MLALERIARSSPVRTFNESGLQEGKKAHSVGAWQEAKVNEYQEMYKKKPHSAKGAQRTRKEIKIHNLEINSDKFVSYYLYLDTN